MEKPFLASKTVWAGLVIAAIGVLEAFGVPVAYSEALISLAAGFGLYGLRDAISKNK